MQSGDPGAESGAAPEQVPLTSALASAARALLSDLRCIAAAQLHLLALEAREASCHLVAMAALGAAAGLLLALAWVGLAVACALFLLEQGVRTSLAVLASCGLNLLAAALALSALRRLFRAPRFSATLSSLGLGVVKNPEKLP